MYTLKHNAIETTILHAIPAFPNDRNMLPREVILLAAYDFCEQFVRSVRAYQESNRDERFKPCMKQQQYTEPIYHILEARHDRPIYHDKNNVYQVLFAVSCLMGVPNHTRSWWEQTFAERTQEYLEHTTLFQGAQQQIRSTIQKVSSLLQYELEFGAAEPEQAAHEQTDRLLFEAAEMEQMVSDAATKPRQPAKRKKKTIMLPAAQQLHLHFHGDVENKAVVNIISSNVTYTDNSRNYTINTVE